MKVGILSLQGDVREHSAALERAGATPVEVRYEVKTPARGESSRSLHALDGVGTDPRAREMQMPIAVF